MTKYLVAVSGGVDSVVLLDMLVSRGETALTVAHFDHGIRDDSAADARFVQGLAEQYGLPFEIQREELGATAGETLARSRRYAFLRELAKKHDAMIVTAHHRDDLVETVAINVLRGTGWRGLAVLADPQIERPLLAMTKRQVYDYALARRLEWVEDSTNQTDRYLRNRVRRALAGMPSERRDQISELRDAQLAVSSQVNQEAARFASPTGELDRYFLTMIEAPIAEALLWYVVKQRYGVSLLKKQCEYGVLAIKTARPGTEAELGQGIRLQLKKLTALVGSLL